MMLEVGMTASRTRMITGHEVALFAEATGDENPLHLDETYAAGTQFGRPIAHGMLVASLISAVLANDLPGPGALYASQTLRFPAPVYLGETVTAAVEVIKVRSRTVTLSTTCTKADGTVVIEGEAVVFLPKAG
ncbi:MAG: MaoC family dehydratase [Anaerolineae bacterium]|nr:MaoC family dehydratase [Anaerolineae bacterium]